MLYISRSCIKAQQSYKQELSFVLDDYYLRIYMLSAFVYS